MVSIILGPTRALCRGRSPSLASLGGEPPPPASRLCSELTPCSLLTSSACPVGRGSRAGRAQPPAVGAPSGQSWEEQTLCDLLRGLEAVGGRRELRRWGEHLILGPQATSQGFTPRQLPPPAFFQILLLELRRRKTRTQMPRGGSWEGCWVSWATFSIQGEVQF